MATDTGRICLYLLVEPSIGLLREAVDLGVLTTRDSSLICLDFAIKVYILERKQVNRRFSHHGGN
jgi:hypothetical protein